MPQGHVVEPNIEVVCWNIVGSDHWFSLTLGSLSWLSPGDLLNTRYPCCTLGNYLRLSRGRRQVAVVKKNSPGGSSVQSRLVTTLDPFLLNALPVDLGFNLEVLSVSYENHLENCNSYCPQTIELTLLF